MRTHRKSALVLFLCLIIVAGVAYSQGANPFTGGGGFDGGTPRGAVGTFLGRIQLQLQDALGRLLRGLEGDGGAGLVPLVLGVSIVYGFVHAMLPGHRKTLLFSYFLSSDARPIHAVVAGGLLGLLHALSAVALIVGGYYLLQLSLSGAIANIDLFMQRLSGILILLLGVVLLVIKLIELIAEMRSKHDHLVEGLATVTKELDPEGKDPTRELLYEHRRENSRSTRRQARTLPAIIVSGVIPCPGSALVLLFSLSVGVLWAGVVAVLSISVGMALALILLSLATIFLKDRIVRLFHGRAGHLVHAGVELFGALVMLIFGLVLVTTLYG